MLKKKTDTDICIIGAGPGGATAALFLAKKGISSVLLDREKFPRDKICGDALSGKVVSTLKKLDPVLVEEFEKLPVQLGSWGVKFVAPNFKALRVPFKKNFNKEERSPGFISKRIDFDNFLYCKVKDRSLISAFENAEVKSYEKTDKGYKVETADQEIEAKLLIVADGAQSSFSRHIAGIKMEPKHYSAGLRAYYKGVEGLDEDNFIELHFLKDVLPGYFWIFPLPGGYANVGLGMRSDKVAGKKINLKAELKRIVNEIPAISGRFKNAELQGEVKGFGLPLGSKKRDISGDNYLLVGDAASLIDPFTGEGISNAMISGMFAAEHAEKALQEHSFKAGFNKAYDQKVYSRLGKELSLSTNMQMLIHYPWLFNMVVNKAERNKELAETISCMFDDLDLRKRLRDPGFYFRLLFS